MEDFGQMQKKLESMEIEAISSGLVRIPQTTTQLDVDHSKKVLRLIEALEEDDDVQDVFHNLEISDELMAEL